MATQTSCIYDHKKWIVETENV